MKEKLHAKRAATEKHIRELETAGKAGERYTIMMPDILFMILGLLCDVGWIIQLISGFRYLRKNTPETDGGKGTAVIADLILILIGIGNTIHLGKIHEKEIATRKQKDRSFGLTVLGGIFGITSGLGTGDKGLAAGGALNVAGGLPIFLSFRKGIHYGVK